MTDDPRPPAGMPRLAPSLHTCPATGRVYPEGVHRITLSGIVWTFCPWCKNGSGEPQPHPYMPEAHDHE